MPRGNLETDLVNHAETDERGERQSERDCDQVHIDGQPVPGVRAFIAIPGCHKTPWFLLCSMLLPLGRET